MTECPAYPGESIPCESMNGIESYCVSCGGPVTEERNAATRFERDLLTAAPASEADDRE